MMLPFIPVFSNTEGGSALNKPLMSSVLFNNKIIFKKDIVLFKTLNSGLPAKDNYFVFYLRVKFTFKIPLK